MPGDEPEKIDFVFPDEKAAEMAMGVLRHLSRGDASGLIVVTVSREEDGRCGVSFEGSKVTTTDVVMTIMLLLTSVMQELRSCSCGESHAGDVTAFERVREEIKRIGHVTEPDIVAAALHGFRVVH